MTSEGYYATAAELDAEETARKANLTSTAYILGPHTTTTTHIPLLVAPSAGVASAFSFVTFTNVAAADNIYWTMNLVRVRAGVSATIATKSTQLTGGEAMVSLVPWVMDPVGFDATNKVLAAGDVVEIVLVRTSGTGLSNNFFILRWTPTA